MRFRIHHVYTLVLDLTTSDISAIADEDYETKYQLPVTVEAGQTHLVPIEIKDDTRFESDETFLATLNGSAVGEGIQIMSILIEDDDGKQNHFQRQTTGFLGFMIYERYEKISCSRISKHCFSKKKIQEWQKHSAYER